MPWDSAAFGFRVGQVDEFDLGDGAGSADLLASVQAWMDSVEARIVSCRLSHSQIAESMALESIGFRFIEFILRPRLIVERKPPVSQASLRIRPAVEGDLNSLVQIASTVFDTGRYAIDPRLPSDGGGRRYAAWVRDAFTHPSQRLLIGEADPGIVGFFVVERLPDERMYWHLTAVAPRSQGRGIGRLLWEAMLAHHAAEGVRLVETRISGHNVRVLRLYSALGSGFDPPEITLHWVSPTVAEPAVTRRYP